MRFVRGPAVEGYGTIAVFENFYGNFRDLVQRRQRCRRVCKRGNAPARSHLMRPEKRAAAPTMLARIAGALYLYIFVAGLFAEAFVRGRLVVPGDAAATAANIVANETLFRIGFTGELIHVVCDVGIAAILYVLFRPAHRTLALLATLTRVAAAVVLAVSSIGHFAALRLLSGASYLAVIDTGQREAMALTALRLQADGYGICLLFFGVSCGSLGWLILKSGLVPKAIGVLLAIAGVCYFANSLAGFLAPAFAASLFPAILVPAAVAELSFAVWLVAKGVDTAKWRAMQRG